MSTVTIHQAKTHLSRLIADVLAGKEVVIARGSKPVVRLVALDSPHARAPGSLKGQIDLGPSFFDPLPDSELGLWNGTGANSGSSGETGR